MPENTTNISWSALYMPASSNVDPSLHGLPSEDAAWEYVYSRMCERCKMERERSLAGEGSDNPEEEGFYLSTDPPCSAEWMVVRSDELEEGEGMEDILGLGGLDKGRDVSEENS